MTRSLIGSAEYSITHLRTKVLVITGHTKCGAVTAAVEAVHNNIDLSSVAGSIGTLLADIIDAAKKAVATIPNATVVEQVSLPRGPGTWPESTTCPWPAPAGPARHEIQRFQHHQEAHPVLRHRVHRRQGDFGRSVGGLEERYAIHTARREQVEELQLIGAVYNIFSGEIEWLGEHPEIEKLCGREMPMHRWNSTPYNTVQSWDNKSGRSARAVNAIRMMEDGNTRFVTGRWHYKSPTGLDVTPSVIVLGGSEYRVPIEDLFDVDPGRIIVQRVLGSVAGMQERTAFSSIEYSIARWAPPVLLVLVESSSPIIEAAIKQLRGQYLPLAPIRVVLNHVMVSALRAVQQAEKNSTLTSAGQELLITQLATELNCLYSMELLLKSKVVRERVLSGELELHAAIMDSGTGKVRFFGEHPRQMEIMRAAELRARTYSTGLSATLPREDWGCPFEPLGDDDPALVLPNVDSQSSSPQKSRRGKFATV